MITVFIVTMVNPSKIVVSINNQESTVIWSQTTNFLWFVHKSHLKSSYLGDILVFWQILKTSFRSRDFFRITWHRQYGIYCLFVIFYILYTIDYRLLFGFCFFPVLNLLPFLDDLWFSVFPKARLFNKRQGLLNHLKSKVLVFMPHPNSRCWSKKSQKKSWNGMFLYALKLEGAWL